MSSLTKSLDGGFVGEDIEVHGGADRLRSAANRDRDPGARGLPEDGDLGADVLSLEAQLWGACEVKKRDIHNTC